VCFANIYVFVLFFLMNKWMGIYNLVMLKHDIYFWSFTSVYYCFQDYLLLLVPTCLLLLLTIKENNGRRNTFCSEDDPSAPGAVLWHPKRARAAFLKASSSHSSAASPSATPSTGGTTSAWRLDWSADFIPILRHEGSGDAGSRIRIPSWGTLPLADLELKTVRRSNQFAFIYFFMSSPSMISSNTTNLVNSTPPTHKRVLILIYLRFLPSFCPDARSSSSLSHRSRALILRIFEVCYLSLSLSLSHPNCSQCRNRKSSCTIHPPDFHLNKRNWINLPPSNLNYKTNVKGPGGRVFGFGRRRLLPACGGGAQWGKTRRGHPCTHTRPGLVVPQLIEWVCLSIGDSFVSRFFKWILSNATCMKHRHIWTNAITYIIYILAQMS
jgi:hypothetical protein